MIKKIVMVSPEIILDEINRLLGTDYPKMVDIRMAHEVDMVQAVVWTLEDKDDDS